MCSNFLSKKLRTFYFIDYFDLAVRRFLCRFPCEITSTAILFLNVINFTIVAGVFLKNYLENIRFAHQSSEYPFIVLHFFQDPERRKSYAFVRRIFTSANLADDSWAL